MPSVRTLYQAVHHVFGQARSKLGVPVPLAKITVTDAAAGGAATVYSDEFLTTVASQPIVAGSDGRYEFFVGPGRYSLSFAGNDSFEPVEEIDVGGQDFPSGTYAPSTGSLAYALGPVETRLEVANAHAAVAPTPQVIVTPYDPDLAVVEPSVLHFPQGWHGWKYWLFASPYKDSNAIYENPSVWVSNDGDNWQVSPAGPNPIFPTAVNGGGINSDQSACVGPDGTIYMVWNQEAAPAVAGGFWVNMASTRDGVTWSAAQAVITTVRAVTRPVSPSMVYDPYLKLFVLYAIDAVPNPSPIVRYTAPTPSGPWTLTTAPVLPTWPVAGRSPFHLNAIYYGGQHILLVNDATNGTSNTQDLYLLTSNDGGVTFDKISAAIMPLAIPLYRSTMVPVETGGGGAKGLAFDLWYGKIDPTGGTGFRVWRTKIYLNSVQHGTRPLGAGERALTVPGIGLTGVTTLSMGANIAYYSPLMIRDTDILATGAYLEVTVAPAANANLMVAVYKADRNLQPKPGLVLSTSFAIASGFTGATHNVLASLPLPIDKYVVRLVADVAMTLRAYSGDGVFTGVRSTLGATPFVGKMQKAEAYADPAPDAPAAWDTYANTTTALAHAIMWQTLIA